MVLAAYLVLLAASHAVRGTRPEPGPAPGLSLQQVEGWPRPKRGPVTIAYREWRTDSGRNLSTDGEVATDSVRTPVGGGSFVTDSTLNLSTNLSGDLARGVLARPGSPGYPVLLLHGSPGSGRVFRRLGSELGARRRAIAPDLPGFGGSTTKIPDYSIRAHAEMTLQLLDSLAIERAHVVGFSLGGGVALEMYRADSARIASLTLLSSIGAQEYELLGEYYLNHAIHGLQLFAIWTLRELVPHFGYADDAFLGHSYARNFYDTDQRPLRGILNRYGGPMLIVHGADDPLVPAAAAEEHHRIVPQSEMVMLDGNHFMTFLEPDRIAPPIEDFLGRAEAGTATVRATAEPARAAAAATPFDPSTLPPAAGFALVVALLLIVAATFVSEDLTCIGTGLLIARGSLPWTAGVGACLVGLVVGDLLLYAGGRWIGRPVTRIAPLRWMIRPEELERACRWFTERSAALLIGGRFVPGTRLPTYVAAGVVHMPLIPFSLWIVVAAALWTPFLVGGTALFGAVAAEQIGTLQQRALPWLIVTALVALIALRIGVPLFSTAGRRRFLARWGRVRGWEFWPPWLFYLPVLAWGVWLAVKHRSLTVFTAANPAFPDGGLVGESKSEILGAIGNRVRVARTVVAGSVAGTDGGVRADVGTDDGVRADAGDGDVGRGRGVPAPLAVAGAVGGLPVVVKPDVGERGAGVAIVRSEKELRERLAAPESTLIVQEYVPGEELGVFYYRFPGEARGHIFGITEKRQPVVTGDGRRSLGDLIMDDRRLRCQRRVFERTLGAGLDRVPDPGEQVVLEERGNHCFGCEFRDGAHLAAPALAAAIDEVSRSIDGFYFGRYDIRGETMAEIQAGKFIVIELNGVSSEATNIYDPRGSLRAAYGTLFRQWELAFRIGAANRALGAPATPALTLLGRLFGHFRPSGARWVRTGAQAPRQAEGPERVRPATQSKTSARDTR
ncbi:MAG: alpha/beta fold hydrolase [Gemmatimonadota bacterium]|nr:alpha/beta fold hydrolase [Gemmatimonadota bacterium]MDE2985601.1 alpha/beta fold hydrolase [Gemmatimonadota bacterium]